MQENTPYTPAPRRSGGRIASIVAGSIAALLAVGFIAAGALLLWGDSQKDDQGYLSTGKDRYAASTYALASDNLDIDLDQRDGSWTRRPRQGPTRGRVERGKPVFVGIARTSDVADYLRGTSYTEVTDVDTRRPRLLPRSRPRRRPPARSAGRPGFWAASAHGSARRPSLGTSRTATGRSSS